MSEKNEENSLIKDKTLAEVLIRVSVLEKLLLSKQIISNEELSNALNDAILVFKNILEKDKEG